MADVWDSELEGSTAVHVMAVLANSADDDGTNCFPGTRLIARRARVSERTVIRTIQDLEQEGWLWVIQRGLGKGNRTEYRLNVNRLHAQAEKTRAEEQERKRCHGVTFSKRPQKVTSAPRKGDTGAAKGDIGDRPLYVLPVNDTSPDTSPPNPLPREGARDVEIERAIDQVCSALAIVNRRKRRPVGLAIAHAVDRGEVACTIALDIVAAVRDQDRLYLEGSLKYKFGLEKFVGNGIWRDRDRWGWDTAQLNLQAQARVGSAR
jgi:DNA-binding transcriptional regulator YhcF (GntR family)